MRPLRSFLLLLIFLACFTGLHYIIQTNQLFPSIYEFIPASLIKSFEHSSDSLPVEVIGGQQDTINISVPDTIRYFNNPFVVSSGLMKGFIDSLRYSKGQIRIMYYGDSQIEGDRITSYLRHSLRKDRGGTGPGLFLPLMPVMYTNTIWIRSSSNWKRYNYLSFRAGEISHRKLGPFMTICRFLDDGEKSFVPVKASVKIRPSKFADNSSSDYDRLRIFYGNAEDTVNLSVKADGKEIFSDTLRRGKGLFETACPLNHATVIDIEFKGKVSPDIYGLSIESDNGVIIDNIPQRGSAGLEFTMVDKTNLTESYRKLSPDLFVLQYGLNIVRNVTNDYSYYQKGLSRQLALLKEISPESQILLVSLTDMAEKEGDSIVSFRNIPYIIEAQRTATVKAGIPFWDSYNAMGGRSSIIKWEERKPPLAQEDYVHFTYRGADTLSKLLLTSMFDYRNDSGNQVKKEIKPPDVASAEPMPVLPLKSNTKVSPIRSALALLLKYDPGEPMIFSTPAFWLFFLFVLAGYSVLYKKMFLRNLYLFILSLFFYYKSGGLFLFLLIFVTVVDYSCGLLIYNSRTKFTRKLFILLSIISNLGVLAYFKYTGFFVHTINDLFGSSFKVHDYLAAFSNLNLGTTFDINNIILPVGISFFTFQSLSYTIDVYRKKLEPVRNIIDFGFYVSFFPQLVAGPIVRASEFIPQLLKEYQVSKREFSHALFLISKGLIKKIIISDFIAVNLIDRVFDTPSAYSGFENLLSVYGYGLQIYCDFSGYTDIAIGLALILGFRLPVNFNSPYKASSISDFWKRWHISLSRWLKDYLYIPLGGNRKGKIRTNINLMITMLLGGLWHGADLRFIIWGLLHGLGLVMNKIWESLTGGMLTSSRLGRIFAVFITFQFVSFCWIFFRAPDMENVRVMLQQIFENFSPGSYMAVLQTYSSVIFLIAIGYLIHFLPERIKEAYRGLFIKIPLAAQMVVILLVAIMLFQMRSTEIMPFIYFRF